MGVEAEKAGALLLMFVYNNVSQVLYTFLKKESIIKAIFHLFIFQKLVDMTDK